MVLPSVYIKRFPLEPEIDEQPSGVLSSPLVSAEGGLVLKVIPAFLPKYQLLASPCPKIERLIIDINKKIKVLKNPFSSNIT
jgi:hypothetical protein